MNRLIQKKLLWNSYKMHVRHLLSSAYGCLDAWESRHVDPVLKDKDSYELLADVQRKFLGGGLASAVDVDIMVNKLQYSDQLEELKVVLHKIRHSTESARILDSTLHAIVRLCLSVRQPEFIIDLLDQTINFGVFPDVFAANLLMDHFIEQKNYRNAAKVGCYLMQQEMLENETACWLSVYSCVKWLEEGGDSVNPWVSAPSTDSSESQSLSDKSVNDDDDDDDELVFKVPWLKNPYYDDHFDISEPNRLVGKTLAWMSRSLPESPESRNSELLGCLLMNEEEQSVNLFETQKNRLLADVIEIFKKVCSSDTPLPNKIPEDAILKEGRLSEMILERFTERRAELELQDVSDVKNLYQQWNDTRHRLIRTQVERFLKKERLKEIEEELKKLDEKEEILTFFENKEKWEKMIAPELLEKKLAKKDVIDELPSDEEYAKLIFEAVEKKQKSKKLSLFEK